GDAGYLSSAEIYSTFAASSISCVFPVEYENQDFLGSLVDNSAGSGVTFRPAQNGSEQDVILVLDNNPRRVLQFTRGGTYQRTITLGRFVEPEDIHWVSGNTYVISQEENGTSTDEIVVITLPYGTSDVTVNISSADRRLQIADAAFVSRQNKGIEAVTLLGGNFYFT